MKSGQKVNYYATRTAYVPTKGKDVEYIKHHTGTIIAFSELECEVLPDGKTKTVRLPTVQIKAI